MLKRLCLTLAFLLACAISAFATDITVGAFQISNNHNYTGTITMRVYYSGCAGSGFLDSNGVFVACGSATGNFYASVPVTLVGSTLTVSSFTLPSTDDSSQNNVVATARFFTNSTQRDLLFSNYVITNTLGSSISFAQLYTYNQAVTLPNPQSSTYLTAPQVAALITQSAGSLTNASQTIKGITKLSVDPVSATDPIALGVNDRRVPTSLTPQCAGIDDTGAFSNITSTFASSGGTLKLPRLSAGRCKVSNISIPDNVLLDNTEGTGVFVITGQTLTVSRVQNPDGKQIFYNIGTGLGSVAVSLITASGSASPHITPQWFGATGDGATDDHVAIKNMSDFALGKDGSEHAFTNSVRNIPMYFPAGTYNLGSSTWLIRDVVSAEITGAGRFASRITSSATAFRTDGIWYSKIANISFSSSGNGQVTLDIDGNVPAHPYATRSVQGNTFTDITITGNGIGSGNTAYYQCRLGGSGAQCENTFINSYFANADDAWVNNGFNALGNIIIRGDMQDFITGIRSIAGSVNAYGTTFESTHPYEQVTQGGFDIHIGEAGVLEKMHFDGIRTESLQFFKGSSTQTAQLSNIVQGIGSVTQWFALNGYTLHQVLIKSVVVAGRTQPHAFQASTAGTSGAVEPVWPASGTIADGSVVWTELPFFSVDTQTISGNNGPNTIDIQNSSWAGPLKLGGWASSQQSVNGDALTGTFAYQPPFWQFPRYYTPLDAAGGDFTVTLNEAPLGTLIIFKRVDSTANVVTIQAGSTAIDGAASFPLSGGSNRQYVALMYEGGGTSIQWMVVGKSDATFLNGATFSAPGTIGGGTPAAGTFTTLTANTSLTINGGTAVTKILSATASLDFTALAANSCEVLTITVTGAVDGDTVTLGVPNALADVDGATERTVFYGFVSAADTVSVRRCNVTAVITANPAAATVRAMVTRF